MPRSNSSDMAEVDVEAGNGNGWANLDTDRRMNNSSAPDSSSQIPNAAKQVTLDWLRDIAARSRRLCRSGLPWLPSPARQPVRIFWLVMQNISTRIVCA